jgi:uroporphyrinogen decarboxylase
MQQSNLFLRACKREKVERVPVWYMRQAGRYDPEYRKIKEKYSLLEICKQPELAAEVTLMPVRKLGVDAAILYSDIMNPVASIGINFDIVKNIGPVIDNPIRSAADVARLKPIDVEGDLNHILQTIRILRGELNVPLISFAGAPFTLASYLVEGRPSKGYRLTKTLMYSDPNTWFLLMDKLADMAIAYMKAHFAAGAQAIQLFDSWAGSLTPADYVKYVYPAVDKIFKALKQYEQPKIYFPGVASGELFACLRTLDADVIGVDWRVSLQDARNRLQRPFAVQGNLDPFMLEAPDELLQAATRTIIDQGAEQPGHIFNLGHGLYPEASLEKLQRLTQYIQEYSVQVYKKTVAEGTK